jgi:hypothetical protein
MPQRTNDFQELVALVQKALRPEGAKVTESAMVPSNDGATMREIDVLVDTPVGPYCIQIAVEAKDERRKMDLTKFESILGKYLVDGGVSVQKVVVVTHHGFSETVVERAKLLEIDLYTLQEARTLDWTRFRPPVPCLESAVEILGLTYNDEVPQAFGGTVPTDSRIACECGRTYPKQRDYANYFFFTHVLKTKREELIRFDNEAMTRDEGRKLKVEFGPSSPHRPSLQHGSVSIPITKFGLEVLLKRPQAPKLFFDNNMRFEMAPHVCRMEFIPPITTSSPKEVLNSARIVCSCCQKDHGAVKAWAHRIAIENILAKRPDLQRSLTDSLQASATGDATLSVEFPFEKKHRVVIDGEEFSPSTARIVVHAVAATGRLEHRQLEYCKSDGTKSIVDKFEAALGGKRLRLLMPDGLSSKKLILRIDNATPQKEPSPAAKDLTRRRKKLDQRRGGKRKNK